ncbi:MAG: hypothetical protein ABSF96_07635 [Steroidobacteraceae bacterium]
MTAEKIVGLIGLVVAIVAAFVAIPYVELILLIIGLIVGWSIAREDTVRVVVTALALTAFAHYFDVIPDIGRYLASILGSFGLLTAGAAIMLILRNMHARFWPSAKTA